MFRSPIFILLVLLLFSLWSCKDSLATEIISGNETKKNNIVIKARECLNLGDTHYSNQNFDSAFYYYNRSKILYEIEKDTASISYNLIQMARIQQISGDYFGSETSLVEALPYIQKDSDYESATYNLLGISSKELFNYDDALHYYQKAKNISKDTLAKIILDNNIAAVYMQKKDFNSSINILNNILKSKVLDTIEKRKAIYLDNLGFSFYKASQNSKGLELMNQALEIKEKNDDSYGIIESYLHLAEYYKTTIPNESSKYAFKAYETATSNNSIDERLESLSFLMSNSFATSKNNYSVTYLRLNDSIKKVRNNAKNQFAKIKYDSRKANEENLKLKAQKAETDLQLERQRSRNTVIILGLIILIGVFLYVVNFLKNKNKRERIETAYNTETRIAKKLHDELANDVYQAMAFAETQNLQNPEKKELLLDNLDKIYSRTRNISRENSSIDTGEMFEPNLKEMLSSYNSNNIKLIIKDNNEISWLKIPAENKIAIHRVLQELLVNMKKHSKCTHAIIGFENHENNIEINYSDNGIGLDNTLILKNGLQNVENRIQAIRGTITFDSETNKGFKVKISFPK